MRQRKRFDGASRRPEGVLYKLCACFATMENITVVLLLVGGGNEQLAQSPRLLAARQLVDHLRISSTRPLDIHLATDSLLPSAPSDWRQHRLDKMPDSAKAMHIRYEKITHGPGSIYMWKPLLHTLLPTSIERALVLDTDLYLPSADLADLWDEFDNFPPEAALGLAREQQPTYARFASGGVNGGVQLLHLGRMREPDGLFAQELERCATGACGDIGYLGDQTFYSAAHNSTPSLFHILSCGWNRQLSDQYWNDASFASFNKCESTCKIAHGNQPAFKRVLSALQTVGDGQRRATCAECEAEIAAEGSRQGASPTGSFMAMADILKECCCGGDNPPQDQGTGVH